MIKKDLNWKIYIDMSEEFYDAHLVGKLIGDYQITGMDT